MSATDTAARQSRTQDRARVARDWAVRAVFLTVVLGCGAWSLDGRWDELGAALGAVAPYRLLAAVVLTCAGLALTCLVWQRLMRAFGHAIEPTEARSVFFVSQLGKYIPGAVWAIGVQARLAARSAVPVRVTVTVALLFTAVHLLSAGMFAGALVVGLGGDVPGPRWLWLLGAVACAIGFVPAVTGWLVRRTAGTATAVSGRDAAVVSTLMLLTWTLYASAVLLLMPTLAGTSGARAWAVVAVAFACGYVAGVLVVVAPAGLGAREAVFVLVLSPLVGVPAATAVALLARAVHAVADLIMAAYAFRRRTSVSPGLSVSAGNVRSHDDDRL